MPSDCIDLMEGSPVGAVGHERKHGQAGTLPGMELQLGSNRQKVVVGVNLWSEYVDEEKKSVREQSRQGCRIH